MCMGKRPYCSYYYIMQRYYFFFSPPAHLCAVTYMTEISLIVTLNKQYNSTQLNKLGCIKAMLASNNGK